MSLPDWVAQRGLFLAHHAAGFEPSWPWDALKPPEDAVDPEIAAEAEAYLLTHSALR